MPTVAQTAADSHFWDITRSADKLGSLAGILAAFAFGGLIIMLATPPRSTDPTTMAAETSAVHLLLGSFFSLIVAAFLFGVLSGYGASIRQCRPFVEGLLASWIMALSTVELCLCTVWLLKAYGVAQDTFVTGRGIAYGAIFITSLSLTGVAVAPLFQRGDHSTRLVLTWVLISLLPWLSIPIGTSVLTHFTDISVQWTVAASVAATVAMAIVFGFVDSQPEKVIAGLYGAKHAYLSLLPLIIVLAALYSLYIALLPS